MYCTSCALILNVWHVNGAKHLKPSELGVPILRQIHVDNLQKMGVLRFFVLGRGIWYIGSLKPVHRIKSESWNWLWMIKVLWWRWRSTMKHMHCIHTHHASWLSFGTVHYSRLLAVFLLSFGKLTWQDTTIICKYQLLYVPFKFPYVTIWYNMFNRRVMFVY